MRDIRDTYERSVGTHKRWTRPDGTRAYAATNADEYFAELTMWYFGSHGEYVRRSADASGAAKSAAVGAAADPRDGTDARAPVPPPGPGGLASYDPDGFTLLSAIYAGNHPKLAETEPKPLRLRPLGESRAEPAEAEAQGRGDGDGAGAGADEGGLVQIEFDNRGCASSWRLFWLPQDSADDRRPYGQLAAHGTRVQQTYPGHVRLLERIIDAGDGAPENGVDSGGRRAKTELRYAAATRACAAPVADDAAPARSGGGAAAAA